MSSNKVVAINLWGGFGSRQRSMTRRTPDQASKIKSVAFKNMNAVPKPLMVVATVPMSRICIEKLIAAGVDEIYGTTHVLHDAIEAYYMDGPGKGLGVRELWYENKPMGTAPGLVMNLMLRASLREGTVVVPSGDIISDLNITDILNAHHDNDSICTIALNPVPAHEVQHFGTAHFIPADSYFGSIDAFREKRPPREALQSQIENRKLFLNNSSFYLFNPELFLRTLKDGGTLLEKIFPGIDPQLLQEIKSGKIDATSTEETNQYLHRFGPHNEEFNDFGSNVFPLLAEEGIMRGYYFERYWNDVGDNETYWFANWHALTQRFQMNIPFPEVDHGVWIDPSAQVIEGSVIIPPVILGKNVKIEPGAIVGPYAILDNGWTVERGAQVAYSLTWPTFVREGYPSDITYHVIRSGARIEKSIIAGRLPIGDHTFKVVIGDGSTLDKTRLIRTVVGLKIKMGSDIAVTKQTKRILIVDDSKEERDPIVDTLKDEGWECIEIATNEEEAREKLNSTRYDAIILDSILSDDKREESEGVALLKEQKYNEHAPNYETPVLFWSGYRSTDSLRGLSPRESFQLASKKVILKIKGDEDVERHKLSEFILKNLLEMSI